MSKRHSKAAKEPWLLVTSLLQSRENPKHIVRMYRQRMRIEENFKDRKCPHYGLGLKDSLTKGGYQKTTWYFSLTIPCDI